MELDPEPGRLPKKVIRHAARDREIEQLTSVEALATAAGLDRPVDDQRERAGRADRCHLTCNRARHDREHSCQRVHAPHEAQPRSAEPTSGKTLGLWQPEPSSGLPLSVRSLAFSAEVRRAQTSAAKSDELTST